MCIDGLTVNSRRIRKQCAIGRSDCGEPSGDTRSMQCRNKQRIGVSLRMTLELSPAHWKSGKWSVPAADTSGFVILNGEARRLRLQSKLQTPNIEHTSALRWQSSLPGRRDRRKEVVARTSNKSAYTWR